MLDKLYKIEKKNLRTIIRIFGIKISIRKKQNKTKTEENNILTRKYAFWMVENKFTANERIWALSEKFYRQVGYFPDFKKPEGFNEKINWMKLNYYDPNQKNAIDKYEFKKYIKQKLGEGYTIPLIGVYEDVNDIDFNSLPEKFVIKTTTGWGGTGIQIIKDKSKLDIDAVKARFSNLMQPWNNYYYLSLSAGYREIKTRIIIEEYMEQLDGQLYDYKFMCFHGEPKWVLACRNRGKNTVYENYDMNWKLFTPSPKSTQTPSINRPKNYDKMIEIAKKLSAPFPMVRIDFYEIEDKIYVGELTFTPGGGFNSYSKEWDRKIGAWLDLSKIQPEYLQILPEFATEAKTFLSADIIDSHMAKEK